MAIALDMFEGKTSSCCGAEILRTPGSRRGSIRFTCGNSKCNRFLNEYTTIICDTKRFISPLATTPGFAWPARRATAA